MSSVDKPAIVTLEEDIHAIEHLNDIRNRAYVLRENGLRELGRSFGDKTHVRWQTINREPNDLIFPAILKLVCTRQFAKNDKVATTSVDEYVGNVFKKLEKREEILRSIFKARETNSDDVGPSDVPFFQAARFMQAMLGEPTTVPTPGFFACYYIIMREMNTAEPPSWMMGSMRACDTAVPSAFVTGECCRAISMFATSIENTAKQASAILSLVDKIQLHQEKGIIPELWSAAELRRQLLSSYTTIVNESSKSLIAFPMEDFLKKFRELADKSSPLPSKDVKLLGISLLTAFSEATKHFVEAAEDQSKRESEIANEFNREYLKKYGIDGSDSKLWRLQQRVNHCYARSKLLELQNIIQKGIEFSENIDLWIKAADSKEPSDKSQKYILKAKKAITGLVEDAAVQRGNLKPSRYFIESVLDRELSNISGANLNVSELVFAAASLSAIDRRQHDERYEKALSIVAEWMKRDGLGENQSHLHTDERGYSLLITTSELLRSLSQLIAKVGITVSPEVLSQIISYFEINAIRKTEGGSILGWSQDSPSHREKAYRWTSGLAILAIDRFARMLDQKINRRVQKHFSTKSFAKGEDVDLDELFYPDYGLACMGSKDLYEGNHDAKGQSVAYYLERARAHLSGINQVPGYTERVFSLILYGPPGTGKTTLLEALACSSYATLIEITPSDILIEGEAWLERRAKIVFKALSYLTRTIIMFDEFDPVLRTRKMENERNLYSFLTPGMLPKLKDLHASAKQRRNVYALITNRIGTLDEAAIRNGRFDHKIGVYPPDLLSRTGRLAWLMAQSAIKSKSKNLLKKANFDVAVDAVVESKGLGMTFLAKHGNFNLPSGDITNCDDENSILARILNSKILKSPFKFGPPDATFDDDTESTEISSKFERDSLFFKLERAQWHWIIKLDERAAQHRNVTRETGDERNNFELLNNLFKPPSDSDNYA